MRLNIDVLATHGDVRELDAEVSQRQRNCRSIEETRKITAPYGLLILKVERRWPNL
jgi:hypothetical protein